MQNECHAEQQMQKRLAISTKSIMLASDTDLPAEIGNTDPTPPADRSTARSIMFMNSGGSEARY